MKRLIVIGMLVMLTITQAKAFDFYVVNNDGVRIYYEIQAGIGNKVMVVNREGTSTYSGIINIPANVTYEGISYVVETIGREAFYGCKEITEVNLPASIKTIRERAFFDCDKLTDIIIPDEVTSIRYRAFDNCNALKTVSLGANLTEIGERAFYQCTRLENITFGNKVSLIDIAAFDMCYYLKHVQLPESIIEIGDYAFSYSGLTGVVIPNNVQSIGIGAFSTCRSLAQVVIGDKVSNIGRSAFADCAALNLFTVSENNQKYICEDSMLLSKDKTVLYVFPGGKKSTIIPNYIKKIGDGAFAGHNISRIEIPDNVVSIGEYAFSGCNDVIEFIVGKNVKDIGIKAFQSLGTYGNTLNFYNSSPTPQVVEDLGLEYISYLTIYVPIGSGNLYKNANYWRNLRIEEKNYTVSNEDIFNENIIISNIDRGISISSDSPATVAVYSMSGQMVHQQYMRDRQEIKLQRGLYIVKVENVTKKVYVK